MKQNDDPRGDDDPRRPTALEAISQRSPRFAGMTSVSGFARSVAGRSRRIRPHRLRGIGLVFRVDAPRITTLARYDQRVVRIEPHFHLRLSQHHAHRTVTVGARLVPVSRTVPNALGPPPSSEATTRPLTRALLRHPVVERIAGPAGVAAVLDRERRRVERSWTTISRESVRRLVFRLLQRSERVDSVTITGITRRSTVDVSSPTTDAVAARQPVVGSGTPVRRVVRRTAPIVVGDAPPRGSSATTEVRSPQTRRLGPPAPPHQGVNVERLTDQVVKAIDRRLIAHRERMGRV